MAVVTIYMSDRDSSKQTFVSKKEADEYDKKLELAENLSLFLSKHAQFLSEKQAEELGLLLANNKDMLANALKGRPELILEAEASAEDKKALDVEAAPAKEKSSDNVRAIAS